METTKYEVRPFEAPATSAWDTERPLWQVVNLATGFRVGAVFTREATARELAERLNADHENALRYGRLAD